LIQQFGSGTKSCAKTLSTLVVQTYQLGSMKISSQLANNFDDCSTNGSDIFLVKAFLNFVTFVVNIAFSFLLAALPR
jgi:hypothetical protein